MLRTVTTRCKPKVQNGQVIAKRLRTTKSKPRPPPGRRPWQPSHRAPNGPNSNIQLLPRPINPAFAVPRPGSATYAPPADLTEDKCHAYFQTSVETWARSLRTTLRFGRFGYDAKDVRPFLDAYVSAAQAGFFSLPENFTKYQLVRFTTAGGPGAKGPEKAHIRLADADITFSNIFFSWIADTRASGKALDELIQKGGAGKETLDTLRHLAQVSQRRPAEDFPWARKLRRKFIMHVGPTNSGKTHHALRALAAANSGVYAGPLRLLAHEIWERLNLGQIIPLGVDVPPPNVENPPRPLPSSSSSSITSDPSIAPQAKIHANPQYARKTNMITGEEHKIVDVDAPLTSCTVEMLSYRSQYDVGVIDEIQMIGDSQRGFAWTSAVLGLCANEIHLCGEASAIPVIEQLLKETGDTLEIRHYERLTPLRVEEKSLGGSYRNVRKGDCIVAFSRSRIFEIKSQIEKRNGIRCAVVYGKLPPEIRSEQAALFNDPNSDFDVIIGSDAIGMGLNLKIRRIIFDQVAKSSGDEKSVQLSISQIKQIAGRAGRYGHSLSGEKPGGYVTTLYDDSLEVLQHALAQPSTPALTHAYICPTSDSFTAIAPALLPSPSYNNKHQPKIDMETVTMAHTYASLLPSPVYKYQHLPRIGEICTWIDQKAKGVLTWEDKLRFLVCPISWRDPLVIEAGEEIIRMQRDEMRVSLTKMKTVVGTEAAGALSLSKGGDELMEKLGEAVRNEEERKAREQGRAMMGNPEKGLIWALEEMERKMDLAESLTEPEPDSPSSPPSKRSSLSRQSLLVQTRVNPNILEELEGLHKILALYMWLSNRNPVVFPDQQLAEGLKHRVEIAMEWGLQEIGRDKVEMGLESPEAPLQNMKDNKIFSWGKGSIAHRGYGNAYSISRGGDRERAFDERRRAREEKEREEEEEELRRIRIEREQQRQSLLQSTERRYGDDYYDDPDQIKRNVEEKDNEREYQKAWLAKLTAKSATSGGERERNQWDKAPDLSTFLNKYVENSSSRGGRGNVRG